MNLRSTIIMLAAAAGFITGCGKEEKQDDPKPAPATGAVKGSFTPVSGGSMVYLIAGPDTTKVTPVSGTFEFAAVKAGSYKITVKPKAGYIAPTPVSATVTGSQTTNVPAITISPVPANGHMSLTMAGASHSGIPAVATFGVSSRIELTIKSGVYDIKLMMPAITAPGTFTSGTSNFNAFVKNTSTSEQWYTTYTGGTATLTVTSFNLATKKGSATFSFTAMPSGNYANRVATNGVLNNVILTN